MTSPVLRLLFKLTLATGLLLAALMLGAFFDSRPLLFASAESITMSGEPVYNQLTWQLGRDQDVWTMRQSHNGLKAKNWDQVAIAVDQDTRKARYLQLQPDGHWSQATDQIPNKIACFTCHTNGPRAIRPDQDILPLNLWDRLRVVVWNLRIKAYGRIKVADNQNIRYTSPTANTELKAPTCNRCHQDDGMFARGPLTRQNYATIRFMLKQGHMPPPGFDLPSAEREHILNFIGGI